MRFPTVLFDLDGTLLDTGPIILASFRYATRTVLGREIPDEVLMAGVGGSGLRAQMAEIDAARVDELVRVYSDHNGPLHESVEVFPGIETVLSRLADEGRRLGVVTAKRRSSVELAWSHVPIGRYFDAVVASEDTEAHKPDPAPLLSALAQLGDGRAPAAYVGDSPFDIRAAHAAGLYAVAVGWGGVHSDQALRAESPHALVHEPIELLDVL